MSLYVSYTLTRLPKVSPNTEKFYFNFCAEYEINEDAKKMLHEVKGPIGVISVAGMYRTGKSYLLNRMLLNR